MLESARARPSANCHLTKSSGPHATSGSHVPFATASHPGTPSLPDFFAFIWGKRTMTAPAGAGQPCAGGSRCVLSDSGWGCGQRRSPTRCLGTCREGPRGGALLRGAADGGRRGQEEQAAVRVGAVAGPLDPWKIADTPVHVN